MKYGRIGWMAAALALAAAAQQNPPPAAPPPPPLPEGTTDDIQVIGDLTVITSERLIYDSEKQYALFEKDVVVSDPHLRMKTDKLTIHFDADNQPQRLLAEGRVVMSQADTRAWAGRVTYNVATGEVVLEDNPRVMRGRDMLMGQRITFWRDQNRLECYPQARLIIYPQPGSARDIFSGGR